MSAKLMQLVRRWIAARAARTAVAVRPRSRFRLAVNQRCGITVAADSRRYVSRIEEVDELTVSLAVPQQRSDYIALRVGDPVTVRVFGATGVYEFRELVQRLVRQNIPLLVVSKPLQIRRIQRRRWLRAFSQQTMSFFPQSERSAVLTQPDGGQRGMLRDISAGGAAWQAAVPVVQGTLVGMSFSVVDTAISAVAQIRRCEPESGGYAVAAEFRVVDGWDSAGLDALVHRQAEGV